MLCLQPRLRVSRLPSSQSESLSQPLSLCRRRRVRATDRGMTVHASNNQLELSFNSLPLLAAAAAVASPASLSRASSSTDQVVRSLQKAPCETVCTNGRKMALLHCCAAEEAQFQEKMICLTCNGQRQAQHLATAHWSYPVLPVFYHIIAVVRPGSDAKIRHETAN